MKTVIVIGAKGKMGKAALSGFDTDKVITAGRSTDGCDYQVDITSEASLEAMFKQVGPFDAVVSAVGECEYAPFVDMTNEQWESTVQSKLLGQMNIVRVGLKYIADNGSFSLISGIHNHRPVLSTIADATTSGAIDTFVKCVSNELPRGIRINAVNPTVLESAWSVYGTMLPGWEPVPDIRVGKAFARTVHGFMNGEVIIVDV